MVDRLHDAVCLPRQDHVLRFTLAFLPNPGKGERFVRAEHDSVRLLAQSSALPFIESVRKDQAAALSECLPESRQPVDGFRARIEEHAPGATLQSGGNSPERRLDHARLYVQDDRQTLAWTCVVDRLVRFGKLRSEVPAERFLIFRDRVAAAHALNIIKTQSRPGVVVQGEDCRQPVGPPGEQICSLAP